MIALHNVQRKRKIESDGPLFQAVGLVSVKIESLIFHLTRIPLPRFFFLAPLLVERSSLPPILL